MYDIDIISNVFEKLVWNIATYSELDSAKAL